MSECGLKRRQMCNRSEDREQWTWAEVYSIVAKPCIWENQRKPDVSGIEKEAVVMDEGDEARLERQLKITSAALLVSSDFNPSALDRDL